MLRGQGTVDAASVAETERPISPNDSAESIVQSIHALGMMLATSGGPTLVHQDCLPHASEGMIRWPPSTGQGVSLIVTRGIHPPAA